MGGGKGRFGAGWCYCRWLGQRVRSMRAASGCSFCLPLAVVMKTKPLSPMQSWRDADHMLCRGLAKPAGPRPSSCWKLTNSFTSPLFSPKMLKHQILAALV